MKKFILVATFALSAMPALAAEYDETGEIVADPRATGEYSLCFDTTCIPAGHLGYEAAPPKTPADLEKCIMISVDNTMKIVKDSGQSTIMESQVLAAEKFATDVPCRMTMNELGEKVSMNVRAKVQNALLFKYLNDGL